MKPILVFDVDGVLVDVTESYREATVQTVRHFTGAEISRERIQELKNEGGWNDDWVLSQKICGDFGKPVPLEEIVTEFNRIFLGASDGDGLIHRERWIAGQGLLERLSERYQLAIFTGRHDFELAPTLFRYAEGVPFDPIVTANKVDHLKPSPEGLRQIVAKHPGADLWYVGDTVDDAASARAAGVKFIGIVDPASPCYEQTKAALAAHGPVAVVGSINELESVLPA